MEPERTNETERLYARGLEAFRAARWQEAVEAFEALQRISIAYPEVTELLDEAQLKLDFARAEMPVGASPPKTRRLHRWVVAGAAAFLLAGGTAVFLLWPQPQPVAVVPTSAPTATRAPTRAPTATSVPTLAPTVTPAPTLAPTTTPAPQIAAPGGLVVRMAEGQELTRAVKNIEIILDASGSMLAQIGGQIKIDIAHGALTTLIGQLPDNTNVALRTYGHRRASDCSDMELVSALGPLDRTLLSQQVSAIRPVPNGRTPMAASLLAIRETLAGADGESLVVLVSDGDETCGGDPARAAADLRAEFPNVRVSVIGFNIEEEEWRARLQGVAEKGGGGYFDAADAAQLEAALREAVALRYRVIDSNSEEYFEGPVGAQASLPAGSYTIEISDETPLKLQSVAIEPGGKTIVELSAAGDQLSAQVLAGQ